ncbi:ATP-binding protein [Peptoniphilus sp. KCTC 25270]|uniref:ATP-binding protein n=1 Tax=Peptoniphilus sp. KCTC 25270 TaxID=2897414 RepID=UPI001E5B117E|nr:ATP-binding protein [Peptoniphilus sp. KCTC 25270]MCD1147728.1 ATP-binding protein [Peptoniphilus sp. KCTC 25270]
MSSIYLEIEKTLERRRDENEKLHRKRVEEIYEKIPEIREIDKEIRSLGFGAARASLGGDKEEASEIMESIQEGKAMKEGLLVSSGYRRDYLDEIHQCDLCKDTGTLEDGGRCQCYKKELTHHLYKMSNVERMIERQNFSTFQMDVFSKIPFEDYEKTPWENMNDILEVVDAFLETFPEPNDMNLLFYGSTGQGKTFLSNAIAGELLERNYIVVYQTAFSLVDILEQRKFRNDGSEELKLKYELLLEADLLVIDDLGTEMANNFTNSQIFNIVNSRLISGKKTLISTNLSPSDISKTYTDRIFSRIFDKFVPVHFYGPDLRWER